MKLRLNGPTLTGFSSRDSREWYTNGDYLVLLVSLFIILPLSLLRNLGKLSQVVFVFLHVCFV